MCTPTHPHTHTHVHTPHTQPYTHTILTYTHTTPGAHINTTLWGAKYAYSQPDICLPPRTPCTCSSGTCTQNPRNPRRGFRHLTEPTPLGLKLLGSGRVTEPTAWVKRGFGAVLGVGSVTLHASTALENETPDPRLTQRQSSEPTLFWSFIFQGCAGIRSSVFGVLRISNPANLFPTALTHQLPRAPPGQSTSTSPRGTPCIGSSGAGAGRGSPPRTPCTCSSGAGAGRGSPPRHLPRFTPRSALSAPGPQSRDRLGGRPTSRPRPAFPRCLLRPDAMVQTQALVGKWW